MNRAGLQRQAAEALTHDLEPGEHIAAGSAVTADPSRRASTAMLALSVVLTAAGLEGLLGPLQATPMIAVGLPIMAVGIPFLPRPMYVAVTNRRLICTRMSRLRSTPRRPSFAAPLADLRIVNYRSGKCGASIRYQVAGRKPMLLHAGRAGRKDFAEVIRALARSGAFAKLDPPYPSAGSLPTAAYRH